ncbi:unnamed protein product [Ectocarpus sp. 8 AP-2014]
MLLAGNDADLPVGHTNACTAALCNNNVGTATNTKSSEALAVEALARAAERTAVAAAAAGSTGAAVARASPVEERGGGGKWTEAIEQLEKERGGGQTPSLGAFERAIQALGAGRKWAEAVGLMSEVEEAGMVPDEDTYSGVIRDCCKSGRIEEATRMLNAMISKGYKPPQGVVNTVLDTCTTRKNTRKVTKVLLAMRAQGLDVDDATYRKAMKACAMANDPTQVVGVWELFVGKGRVVTDVAAAEVSRVARAMGALGDWKGIIGLLGTKSTAGGGSLPDLDRLSYNWLVSAHAQLGDAKAVLASIEDMGRNGHPADADTYSLAFKAFVKSGGRHWGAALDVFRAMQSSSAETTPRGVGGGVVEGEGVGVAEVEASAGVSSDVLSTDVWCKTVTTVAQGSPPRKALSAALSLMEEAQQAGVEVDAATMDAVLTALGRAKGKDEKLLALFRQAEERGLRLKRQSYAWAVVAYKRCGKAKEALDSAVSFSERGIVMTVVGWNAAMHAVSVTGEPGKALELLEEAKSKGVKLTEVTYATAIGACAKATTNVKANARKVHCLHGAHL